MSLDVSRLVLVRGSNPPGRGFSAMEAVAFAAGEAWSERPRCASPAITEWMISWNDGLDDAARQSLRGYVWRLAGSRGTRADERMRQWMVADWLVRWYAPGWLAAAGLRGHASRLSRLPPVRCEEDVANAWPTVRAASRAARAERDMAWRSAAGVVAAHDWGTAGAVWAAIADATWGAAGSAARAVVWSTADPAAPGRVKAPVWDAACDAAADAAGALAWVAVRDAARREPGAAAFEAVDPVAAILDDTVPLSAFGSRSEASAVVGSASVSHRPSVDVLADDDVVAAAAAGPHPAGVELPAGEVGASPSPDLSRVAGTVLVDGGSGGRRSSGVGHWHHSHPDGAGARPSRTCRVCTAEATRVAREPSCGVETEDPNDLAEADDPGEADDMWQLAWETACVVLAPTSAALQASAHDLVDRMLAITE